MKRVLAAAGAAVAAEKIWKRATALDLEGRVAVVTGGSRGLGVALFRELRNRGARVATCARGEEQLQRARTLLGGDVLAIPCDVSDDEQVRAFIDQVEEQLGPVDVLVNNAGVIAVGPLATQTIADFEEMLAIQLWGPIHMTSAVLPGMRERGEGRIANVTSIGGEISVPGLLPPPPAEVAALGVSPGPRAPLARTGGKVTTGGAR